MGIVEKTPEGFVTDLWRVVEYNPKQFVHFFVVFIFVLETVVLLSERHVRQFLSPNGNSLDGVVLVYLRPAISIVYHF